MTRSTVEFNSPARVRARARAPGDLTRRRRDRPFNAHRIARAHGNSLMSESIIIRAFDAARCRKSSSSSIRKAANAFKHGGIVVTDRIESNDRLSRDERRRRTIHAGVLEPESAYETGTRVRVSRTMATERRRRRVRRTRRERRVGDDDARRRVAKGRWRRGDESSDFEDFKRMLRSKTNNAARHRSGRTMRERCSCLWRRATDL